MLWFTSDNGPAVRSPGNTGGLRGSKGTLYEGGIRVPGIIEWPDVIDSNRQISTPVVTNDFLPTVCDILGIAAPVDRPLDGESILPLLTDKGGNEQKRRSSIKWAFKIKDGRFGGSYQVAIINNRNFKLIARYRREKVTESRLYDLSEDPAETTDISAQHQDMYKELLKEVESWRLSVKESAINEVRCHAES
jgi:arylsulfatase A-like enzyme